MEFASSRELLDFVLEQVAGDTPVIVQSDVHYLDYYRSPLHFPGHTFLAVGFDKDAEQIFTSDTHFDGLQRTGFDSFEKAVAFRGSLFPGANRCFIGRPKTLTEQAVRSAIFRSLETTLAGYDRDLTYYGLDSNPAGFESLYLGRRGLELFRERFLDILDRSPEGTHDARFIYEVIDRRGTGGGLFRPMTAEFLKNAAGFLGDDRFNHAAARAEELGGAYSTLAKLCRGISLSLKKTPLSEQTTEREKIAATVENIYVGERRFLESLQNLHSAVSS